MHPDSSKYDFDKHAWRADEIFTIKLAESRFESLNFLNLEFKIEQHLNRHIIRHNVNIFKGSGLYALFFDEQCIYIGSFLGTRENASSGCILNTRWDKHLAGMTWRGKNISISPKIRENIVQNYSGNSKLIDALRYANHEDIQRLCEDKGAVSAKNRLLFAAANWDLMRQLDVTGGGLDKFRFGYVRDRNAPSRNSEYYRKAVKNAETILKNHIKPCCNDGCPPWSGKTLNLNMDEFLDMAEERLVQIKGER